MEVWRDAFAAEEIVGPFKSMVREGDRVRFIGERGDLNLLATILRETVLSIKPAGQLFYLRILRLGAGPGPHALDKNSGSATSQSGCSRQ